MTEPRLRKVGDGGFEGLGFRLGRLLVNAALSLCGETGREFGHPETEALNI